MTQTVAQTFKFLINMTVMNFGKLADIIVWDRDPLEPALFPKIVMSEGNVTRFKPQDLQID